MARTALVGAVILAFLAGCATESEPPNAPTGNVFVDVLSHHGVPGDAEDWSFMPFADQGAWFGMALSPSGFSGPFLMTSGRWLRPELVRFEVVDPETGERIASEDRVSRAYPGELEWAASADGIAWTLTLWYDSATTALVRAIVENTGPTSRRVGLRWSGSVYSEDASLDREDGGVVARVVTGESFLITALDAPAIAELSESHYTVASGDALELAPGEVVTSTVALAFTIDGLPSAEAIDPDASYRRNLERWGRYLDAVDPGANAPAGVRVLAVKSLLTLVNNWRAPAGRFRYSALFPSSNVDYFNGFWAWDSWKHAVALVRFDEGLAKEQVRAMFDHQDASGMVADVVYLDAEEDNWRDTKPPLAGWAMEAIFETTGDRDFVEELYPKLVAYHEFWYAHRDHDGDGLCEYGSTDGTLEAARWESGMDNAVRFDEARMLRNGASAWSMSQESVDLNSYLYREKLALAALARALALPGEAARWDREAEALGSRIRESMFDETSGWFYDIDIDSGEFVRVQGPEGFIPLWAGVATPAQAARVRDTMLDESKFRTHVPFPTVSREHPEFSDGYWRGLVWLDQAYFGIRGLERYGYAEDASSLTRQLFENLQGATTPGAPLYENYDPLTGEGTNVRHFSWTAAHLLLLVHGGESSQRRAEV